MPESSLQRFAPLAGRILLALIFIIAGFRKITGFSGTAAYMASKGLPMVEVLLVATIVVELGGGLMLVLGWRARLAALLLFLFTAIVTPIFHGFWAFPPEQYQAQFNNFMKNIAIMGGMLYVMAYGPGPLSVGGRRAAR
ncbi:MAG: DoxX family protein [Pseudomonadota bacterium]